MPEKENYAKPALTLEQQINLLEERGLTIGNRVEAESFLAFVSYYRFSAYTFSFEMPASDGKRSHAFRRGATFSDIVKLYNFDRELRLRFIDALETVEIAFRSILCGRLALEYGPYWYENTGLFARKDKHSEFLWKLDSELSRQKNKEIFIKHYSDRYDTPKRPPIWMVIEIISLGTSSKLFGNLKHSRDKKLISKHFGLHPNVLKSWFHSLTTLRNICAHHSRLWNRRFPFTPAIPHALARLWENTDKIHDHIWILKILLETVNRESPWLDNMRSFLCEHDHIDKRQMGFCADWQSDAVWKGHTA